MQAAEWLELVDRKMVELRIRAETVELFFGELSLCLRGPWQLLDPNDLKLDSGEGGQLGKRTYLHRVVGARAVAWRFETQDRVALLFSSGHSLLVEKSGAELLRSRAEPLPER